MKEETIDLDECLKKMGYAMGEEKTAFAFWLHAFLYAVLNESLRRAVCADPPLSKGTANSSG